MGKKTKKVTNKKSVEENKPVEGNEKKKIKKVAKKKPVEENSLTPLDETKIETQISTLPNIKEIAKSESSCVNSDENKTKPKKVVKRKAKAISLDTNNINNENIQVKGN